MNNNQYKKLSDDRLWENTKKLAQKERELSLQVIHHLEEIESRKLYLKRGFSSLFHYCVKELQYSETSAYLRIKTMKLCREVPEALPKIKSGKLSLSNAGKLQSFFEKKRRSASSTAPRTAGFQDSLAIPHEALLRTASTQRRSPASLDENRIQLDQKDKLNLIEKAQGKSSWETEKLLASVDQEITAPKERVRELGNGKTEIKIILDQEGLKNLETLKHLLSHQKPNMSYGELVLFLSKLGLKKYDLRRKPLKKTSAQTLMRQPLQKQKLMTRHIPMSIRRQVWQRDQGRCSYKDFKSNRKCGSKHLLQVDHIEPFALGGKHTIQNLRLLCAGHNQYRGQKTFLF